MHPYPPYESIGMSKKSRSRTGRENAKDYINSRGGEEQFVKEATWEDLFEIKPLWWNLQYDDQVEFFMELREVLDPNWREFCEDYPSPITEGKGESIEEEAKKFARALDGLPNPFTDDLPDHTYDFLTYVDSALEYLQDCGEIPMRSFTDTLPHLEAMTPEVELCYTRGLLSMRSRRYQNPIWSAPGEEDTSFHPHDRWQDWQWRFIADRHMELRNRLLRAEGSTPRMRFLWLLSDHSAFGKVRDFFWNLGVDDDGMILCPLNQQDFGFLIRSLVARGGLVARKGWLTFVCSCVRPSADMKEGGKRTDRYTPKNTSKQTSAQMQKEGYPLPDSLLEALVALLPRSPIPWRASPELIGEGAPNLPSV